MKLIIAIIRDSDNEAVSRALIDHGFRVTRVSSTGGFLRRGSSTLMIGIADEKVDEAIQILRDSTEITAEPGVKRATLFVLNVDQFAQV